MAEAYQDQAIVLHVKNWQTADKYVICFSRDHGKLRFIAYGARYPKNVQGRLLQPFARLNVEVQLGQRVDKLLECSLQGVPKAFDVKEMAYGALIAELTTLFTEDHQPQPELYAILEQALELVRKRNPRVVASAYALQLLQQAGLGPDVSSCISCGRPLDSGEEAVLSPLQGGVICPDCGGRDQGEAVSPSMRQLWQDLSSLNLAEPQAIKIKGQDLMELERQLYKLVLFHTDKPLQSLGFIKEMGL